jgi:hypothetical protein
MKQFSLYFLFISTISNGCSTIKETSKHQMETGIYKMRHQQNQHYYAVIEDDTITLHPAIKIKAGWIADTSVALAIPLDAANSANRQSITFVNRSFDFDVISILFKYRPYNSGFPNQLNTNFNAAGYIGHRSDLYILSYDKNPLNSYQRTMNHFGYSFGLFGGLGATQINPFVTNNNVQSEYDGVVFTKGIAGMIGIGDLTFGAAIGLDHLMDKNNKVWIYQAKAWTGFTVGLNLN